MQVNLLSNQTFGGLKIDLKTMEKLDSAINKYVISTEARTKLAKRVAICSNSKTFDIVINKNEDVFVNCKNGTSTPVNASDIAKKFIKAVNIVAKQQ